MGNARVRGIQTGNTRALGEEQAGQDVAGISDEAPPQMEDLRGDSLPAVLWYVLNGFAVFDRWDVLEQLPAETTRLYI
jgi:hypothetical protein